MTTPTRPLDTYVRVSRIGKRDPERLRSPEEQKRDAEAFARSRGLPLSGKVLTDLDESGGTLDRPGLQEALQRVRDGVSGGIVAAYLSRASRDTRTGLDLLDEINRAGGRVYAPNLPDDYTTADGRMLTTIQLAIDCGYRERKSEELERAKAGAIAQGIPVITRPAVGLRQRPDRRLEPDPETAPIVRQVFERRAQGEGPAALGALLEAHGVRTSQGAATWSKQAVYGLIANRVYMGELSYGRDGRYVNPNGVEPIVDRATWEAAQHPNGRRLTRATGDYLLAGVARCWACRYCLQGTVSSRGKRVYRCTRTHSGGRCPAPARIDADTLDEMAVSAFWSITEDLEAEGRRDTPDLHDLEDALQRAERRLGQAMTPAVQDAAGDGWPAMIRERREERDTAADALGRARAALKTEDETPDVATLREAWGRMTTQDRRQLIGLRLDCIAVDGSRQGTHQLTAYPAGTAPADLPRRGFRYAPALAPFPDAPAGARLLSFEEADQEAGNGGI